ncbi:MAG: quinone oxidoreductase [Gammaproteobacteria bacterium]|nr:quinone oxidoreductase [Gammaproteobacteria bacterium]
MPKAIVINEFGGPDVLQWSDVEVGAPGAGEVLLRHTAVGLNFIDTYQRTGLYPLELPSGLGLEAAAVVEATGAGVDYVQAGDRVAYTQMPPGAYSEQRVYPADQLVKLPDGIDDRVAAAAMLKGLTAWYLLHRSYPAQSGDHVLVYAAAGGVGLIVCQWARALGVNVIGVVSTQEKAALAKKFGATAVVMADAPDFVNDVRELTGGEGVAAAYDSVGKDTFIQSLDCIRPHGTMVSFGNASGPVEPFSVLELGKRGSLFLTRPAVFDFVKTPESLRAAAGALFDVIESGDVKIEINQTWPLAEVADAHRALESRQTTGSTVLLP